MLNKGDLAPDFSLLNSEGKEISLYEELGSSKVVLYFYPKNETPGCVAEACSFRDQYEDFLEAGARVIGVSADSVRSHSRFISNRKLPFTLLSDPNSEVAKSFGIKKKLGLLPGRATFVIDQDGLILHSFQSQFMIQKHISESLQVLRQ